MYTFKKENSVCIKSAVNYATLAMQFFPPQLHNLQHTGGIAEW